MFIIIIIGTLPLSDPPTGERETGRKGKQGRRSVTGKRGVQRESASVRQRVTGTQGVQRKSVGVRQRVTVKQGKRQCKRESVTKKRGAKRKYNRESVSVKEKV